MQRKWLRRIAILAVPVLIVILVGLLVYRPALFLRLPTADSIRQRALAASSLILDRNGQLLYEMMDPHVGSHQPVRLEDIPVSLRQAIIATEDASFYENPGVNPWAILRALWINLRRGEIASGGSTITQQVARNLLLDASERYQRTGWRKLREAALAYHMTRTMTKDEILLLYLNETYFGNMAYGVESAARAYFGKPVGQLDLAECALLAGLPQSPAAYNPLTDLPAAKKRQRVVLDLMVKARYIGSDQADLAYREALQFASTPFDIEAPHFCMLVREQVVRYLGEERVRAGGLRVHTTLDLDLQRKAEQHVNRHLAKLNESTRDLEGHNVRNAAVLALDPQDGAVRVMVGSPNYFDADIDGAVNATLSLRQPGSAIKPLTYAAAFERGYSPATMATDVRTSFLTREGTPYVPVNYDRVYHGPVSLRQALASSYNVVAVKLLDEIGIDALASMAARLGITSLDQTERQGLALTLGSCEVQLLQLTAAYGALANGGWRVHPRLIDYVEDGEGHLVYQAPRLVLERVLEARVAYLVTDVLSDSRARIPGFGESSVLELPFPAAVKTGTTSQWRDNWTVGYSSALVAGVWVGNADNQQMMRVSGVSGAAPIWSALMSSAHRHTPKPFPRPTGLVDIEVCAESGLLPGAACPHRRLEQFLAENAPATVCQMHRLVEIDAMTGAVASSDCPVERRVLRRVTFWPAEARLWAEEQGLPMPPGDAEAVAAISGGAGTALGREVDDASGLRLASPDPNAVFVMAPTLPPAFQQIEIVAIDSSALGLRAIDLWVDGQVFHTWSAPPYRVLWPLSPGTHAFLLVGTDAKHNTVRSSVVNVTVQKN